MLSYVPRLKSLARRLRNTMTPAERKLWLHIRKKQLKGIKFYRQRPVGKYIVDFYCPSKNLVIEVDGGHHSYDDRQIEMDKERDKYLQGPKKLKVIRFTNDDVMSNIDEVLDIIGEEMGE